MYYEPFNNIPMCDKDRQQMECIVAVWVSG